jgi:hypothetical protein
MIDPRSPAPITLNPARSTELGTRHDSTRHFGQGVVVRVRRHPALASLALFVLLAVAHTWPLTAHPGVYSRVDNGDYSLNAWAIDWVARTLPTAPGQLFQAGIFYPHPNALAYSEPLILQGALAIPVIWLGGSAVLAYSVVLIAGFALSGWAFALYVRHLTGSWGAGLVAGSLVAFNAHHFVRLTHLQALHLELVPLVFVALDGLLAGRTWRHAVLLGGALASQALISIYLLVFTAWALVCAVLARVREWTGHDRWRVAGLLALAAFASLVLALPVLWPYVEVSRSQGLARSAAEAQACAATWTDYLYTGARIHFEAWSQRFRESTDANFPGFVGTALAVSALVIGLRRSVHVRMWAAVTVGAVLLSVAPRLPGFAVAHDLVPALGAIRCFSRAGQMALVGIGVLAGFGTAWLLGKFATSRARVLLCAGLVLAVNVEAMRAPFHWTEFPGIPRAYDALAAERDAVVLELPFFNRRDFFGNARYMLYATRHRHPLVNGYSGFAPRDYQPTADIVRQFPERVALEWLRRHGVTHVVVHDRWYAGPRLDAINHSSAVSRIVSVDGVSIYRLRGPAPPAPRRP